MICDDVRRRIYAIDHGEELSPEAREHLARCPGCRKLLKLTCEAEAALNPSGERDVTLTNLVMEAIAGADAGKRRGNAVLAVWILGGLTLLGSAVLVRYSLTFHYLLESQLGTLVDLGVTVAIGIALVSYLAAFVLGNAGRFAALGEGKKKAGL
ncbi:MAG: hypothetical protein ACLFQZ_11495 [Spirochaetaceae bacterium]